MGLTPNLWSSSYSAVGDNVDNPDDIVEAEKLSYGAYDDNTDRIESH